MGICRLITELILPNRSTIADFAVQVAEAVDRGDYQIGILICGSGQGVCMTANKFDQIRAALVWNHEMAELSRKHNNANILVPSRQVSLMTRN